MSNPIVVGSGRGEAPTEVSISEPLGSGAPANGVSVAVPFIVDAGNSNLGTLAAGATWTGTWVDLVGYAQIATSFKSDQDGEFSFQFSSDGITADRTVPIVGTYSLPANTDSPQMLAPVRRFYRAIFKNTGGVQANLRIQTMLGANAASFKTRLVDQPSIFASVDIAKTIGFARTEGGGVIRNQSITAEGHSEVSVLGPTTAFGEVAVASDSAIVQLQNFHLIDSNPRLIQSQKTAGASFQIGTGNERYLLIASTGAGAGGSVLGGSVRRVPYRAGQGSKIAFTARFTTPTAGTEQWAGLGDVCDGFAIGCNGTVVGLKHWRYGQREVRTLQVTVAAAGAETATVTLNGVTKTVALVAGGLAITANALARADYSATGGGWDAYAITISGVYYVVFVSRTAAPLTGVYSLASTGVAAGTFARTTPGVVPTTDWIPQTDWNVDVFDGSSTFDAPNDANPSGMDLVPTNLNVFRLQFQYLGAGKVGFRIESTETGQLVLANILQWAGANTLSSFGTIALPIQLYASNGAVATDIKVATASIYGGVEGARQVTGPGSVVRNSKTGIGGTETAVFAIYNPLIVNGQYNTAPIVLSEIVLTNSGGNGIVNWRVVRNATLGSGATATSVFTQPSTVTPLLVDTTFSTGASGGEEVFATYQPPNTTSTRTFDIANADIGRLYPGESLVVLASTPGSNITAAATATYRWDCLGASRPGLAPRRRFCASMGG